MTKVAKLVAALALAGSSAAMPGNKAYRSTAETTPVSSFVPPAGGTGTATATVAQTTAPFGFPTPSAQQLQDIYVQAGGTLPNGPPPAKLANSTLQSFQAIAFNEEFETAFFQSLLANITNGVQGYQSWNGHEKSRLEKIFATVVAQEELHALNAIDTLQHFGALAPMPCQYHFPTTNIVDAVALAEAFTGLVLGTLQDVSQAAASSGDAAVVRAVASVIGQEGEQNGFFRLVLGGVPSESPFLTTSVGPFLFSYVYNNFVVPNSCPFNVSALAIPLFPILEVGGSSTGIAVPGKNQSLTFTTDLTTVAAASKYIGGNGDGLYVTYFSGQNEPISVPVANVTWSSNTTTFDAEFPFVANIMQGLSIASLTIGNNFTGPDDVPAAVLAAPALINVFNDA